MKLFKTPFTQKYDMYYLIGDDNILILKTSKKDSVDTLLNSMKRNSITMYKELPARAQFDCMCMNDSSKLKQRIPETDKQIERWTNNGYLINMQGEKI